MSPTRISDRPGTDALRRAEERGRNILLLFLLLIFGCIKTANTKAAWFDKLTMDGKLRSP
jgi:hypothetical protein